ncbi:hypothetical protein FRC11_000808, partial [Ceratobasidium sp. 423]
MSGPWRPTVCMGLTKVGAPSPNPLFTEPSTAGEPALGASDKATLLDASRVDTKLAANPTLLTHNDDGAIIRCVAVSTYCFKHGRVTITLCANPHRVQ